MPIKTLMQKLNSMAITENKWNIYKKQMRPTLNHIKNRYN